MLIDNAYDLKDLAEERREYNGYAQRLRQKLADRYCKRAECVEENIYVINKRIMYNSNIRKMHNK